VIIIAKQTTKKTFKNKNGEFTMPELVKLKHNNKHEEFMRQFKTITHKCPPADMRMTQCFYCYDCWDAVFEMIHEHKDYYKVGKEIFYKNDLGDTYEEQR
jgi:hypothetical protein